MELYNEANTISEVSQTFHDKLETIKNKLGNEYERDADGDLPFDKMDRSDQIDEAWFNGDQITEEGQIMIDAVDAYRKAMLENLEERTLQFREDVSERFSTNKIKAKDGVNKTWLDYHFKGFPIISFISKISSMQADVKRIENEVLYELLSDQQGDLLSFYSYRAMVLPEKTAFFSGETFKGTIVLGRVDATTKPHEAYLNGEKIDPSAFKNVGVALEFPVGKIGENELNGKLVFKQGDSVVNIPIESKYVVMPKPTSATIAADKMNVVYRGVNNPMTISFVGISDNNLRVSAPGLKKVGNGRYNLKPLTGSKLFVKVSGTLEDGATVTDSKEFRIKELPRPIGKAGVKKVILLCPELAFKKQLFLQTLVRILNLIYRFT
ncbi:MAG: hypothetical protein HRT68_10115 [Flavobacteriaceae bacterium]|nr:hypothetical protein [Flavobacteriaceae bacterium]